LIVHPVSSDGFVIVGLSGFWVDVQIDVGPASVSQENVMSGLELVIANVPVWSILYVVDVSVEIPGGIALVRSG